MKTLASFSMLNRVVRALPSCTRRIRVDLFINHMYLFRVNYKTRKKVVMV